MNAPREERPLHTGRLFDRLADGELDERQRQALLSSLDRQPDGWRQCALALLEAQCWRNEMTTLAHQAAVCPPPGDAVGGGDRSRSDVGPATLWGDAEPTERVDSTSAVLPVLQRLPRRPVAVGMSRAGRFVAVAAGLLLAFSLGIAARDVLSRRGPSGDGPAGGANTSLPVESALRPASTPSLTAPQGPVAQPQIAVTEQSTGPADIAAGVPDDAITFVIPTGQGSQTKQVRVPLVSAKAIAQEGIALRWPGAHEQPLSDPMVRQIEETGHEVHWQRRYAPLQLDDGRQVVFPVDDLEIAPVVFRPL